VRRGSLHIDDIGGITYRMRNTRGKDSTSSKNLHKE